MTALALFPRLLAAQEFNVEPFLGETWYGLYMNGDKTGYAVNELRRSEDGKVTVIEDAVFQVTMNGIEQDMRIYLKRTYDAAGALEAIDQEVVDVANTSTFSAQVKGDKLYLTSAVAGDAKETVLDKPKESLADALKFARWVSEKPEVGAELRFSMFEPMYQKEIEGVSRIVDVEERLFEGAITKVYKVKTHLDLMGIDQTSYVAEDGTTLEDVIAGLITMRLEPEDVAKDVSYNNDTIISNAALVDERIEDARTRQSLRLLLSGPISERQIFNDDRQTMKPEGDKVLFVGDKIDPNAIERISLPVTRENLKEWLKPTIFVQSDAPKLVAKAKEIVGDETDALTVSNKLCEWVNQNVRTTFSARLTNALDVLENLEGDCTEHSVLFIGLARAAGLPAREVAGLIYVDDAKPGFYFHQWAKVWVGQWIDVDPTFNQPVADVTHIKLAEGDLFEQAKIIPIIGKISIEVLDESDTEQSTGPSVPSDSADPSDVSDPSESAEDEATAS